jgi:glyoxylase-like metal-dependent hydrolase (beta-lactamase superfamily II)
LLWDTGLPRSALGKSLSKGDVDSEALDVTVVDQLAKIGVSPTQVSYVGISHYHFDHIGQAAEFPEATLLIGKGDFDVLIGGGQEERAQKLAPWMREGAKIRQVIGDFDVFGDGSVVMLDLPGHTPGHHGLLVNLAKKGPVLLTGDAAHFRENLKSFGVPSFNVNRAQSLASMDRLVKLAENLAANVIIQHEDEDIQKLPSFPQAAE